MSGTSLTILSTSIRRDADGRYCLNDCHKAAGGEPGKRPGEWLRNEQTQALIAELIDAGISASPVSAVKGGRDQGTYVAKELVYAYAMWISPAFHLTVIRAFDAMVMGQSPAIKAPTNMREALTLALQQQEAIEALEAEKAALTPKAIAHEILSEMPGDLGVRDAGRELKVGQNWVTAVVQDRNWACRQGSKLRPAYYGLERGYVRLVPRSYEDRNTGETRVSDDFRITRKGMARLAEIIAQTKQRNTSGRGGRA